VTSTAGAPPSPRGVFDDLRLEQDRLDAVLARLDPESWLSPSAAPGWSVADVVLHLALSEEMVVATLRAADPTLGFARGGATLDEIMDTQVRSQRAEPAKVFERWRRARMAALDALAKADPTQPVAWAATPLRPATLATTRLAEHWAHGLDIAGGIGIAFEDTDRLRHVAWLAQRTLPYAFALAGLEAHPVHCRLVGPGGDLWEFGPPLAPSRIEGSAGEFCRVAARRVGPQRTELRALGPHGAEALTVVRTYAA
jgi:uncharacterized protein (TIGR03084 family)